MHRQVWKSVNHSVNGSYLFDYLNGGNTGSLKKSVLFEFIIEYLWVEHSLMFIHFLLRIGS